MGPGGPNSNFHLKAYVEPALPDRTAFVLEHQSSSSLGKEGVETDGDQRWTASQGGESIARPSGNGNQCIE